MSLIENEIIANMLIMDNEDTGDIIAIIPLSTPSLSNITNTELRESSSVVRKSKIYILKLV